MQPIYNGQSQQDKFVVSVLGHKTNGFFLEIGSNHPIYINNSYVLEKELKWHGIMIEYDHIWLPQYVENRPNSTHIIQDATQINYKTLLQEVNAPKTIDYLQIDLDIENRSTLTTLEILDATVMDEYTFAVVTFEHDLYRDDTDYNTRGKSREIFARRGYVLLFPDVQHEAHPYEDWYVHSSLIDPNRIKMLQTDASLEYTEIMSRIDALAL